MARRIVMEVVGDSSKLEKAFLRSTRAAQKLERDMARVGRSTSGGGGGVFGRLASSLAIGGASFLAWDKLSEAIHTTIDAATEAQGTQAQLGAQLQAVGIQFDAVRGQIEGASLQLSHLSGFNVDELDQSLTRLVRSTGDVNASLRLNEIAADVARGRHIKLAAAADTLGKAYNGQTSALKRLGIAVPKTMSSLDALNLVAERYAGQAKAGATSSEHFHAELHNLEVTIGTALLPVMDELAKQAGKVVTHLNNFAEQAKQPGTGPNTQVQNVKALGSAFGFVAGNINKAAGALGGWTQLLPGLHQLSGLAGLLRLGGVGGPSPVFPPKGVLGPVGLLGGAKDDAAAKKALKKTATTDPLAGFFDAINRRIDRVQDIKGLPAQIARLQQIAEQIRKRRAATKKVADQLRLEDRLVEVLRTIRSDQQQLADDAAQAAAEAKQAAEERAQAARDAAEAARQEAVAWADVAIQRAESTASLQDDLNKHRAKLALLKAQTAVGKRTAEETAAILTEQQTVTSLTQQIAENAKSRKVKALNLKIDWAAFNLEKDDATKSIKDNIRDEKIIIGLIKQHIKLVGRTLADAQDLWAHQQKLKDYLHQKKTAATNKDPWDLHGWGMGRPLFGGGFGSAPPPTFTGPRAFGGAGITINNLNLNGVQDVRGLSDELIKVAGTRPTPRRGT